MGSDLAGQWEDAQTCLPYACSCHQVGCLLHGRHSGSVPLTCHPDGTDTLPCLPGWEVIRCLEWLPEFMPAPGNLGGCLPAAACTPDACTPNPAPRFPLPACLPGWGTPVPACCCWEQTDPSTFGGGNTCHAMPANTHLGRCRHVYLGFCSSLYLPTISSVQYNSPLSLTLEMMVMTSFHSTTIGISMTYSN